MTSAALPVRSNIIPLPPAPGRRPAAPTAFVSISLAIRRIIPDSALPAPTSTVSVTPCPAIQATLSRQRTRPVTCATSSLRITSTSRTGSAMTLATSGTAGGAIATPASASAIRSAAGCISAQWKGALTGSSIARFAPRALAISTARSTAALSPETTTCAGSLSFAASQTSPCAASAATASTAARSSPSTAAIAPRPTGTASCIACPRSRSIRAVSSSRIAPAAQSAEYSPSECPATNAADPTADPLRLQRPHRRDARSPSAPAARSASASAPRPCPPRPAPTAPRRAPRPPPRRPPRAAG